MTAEADGNPLITILQHCASSAPQPWYPSVYAREKGIDRDSLDPHLDRLRMGGLVQLTDWMQGTGQGYRLTPEGERVLQNPRDLAILGGGKLPASQITEQAPAPRGDTSTWDRGEAVRAAIMDTDPPRVTQVLMMANIAVFVVGLVLAAQENLASQYFAGAGPERLFEIQHELGALTGVDLVRGQWWKLLTTCFVHFGAMHLFFNMFTLYVLGPQAERMWGRWRFLLIYLICGFGGSCAVVWNNPETLGAGASGALWGVMTSYFMWIFLNRQHLPGALSPERLRSWLSVLLINVFISMMPRISAAAHFGGGAVGVIAAWLFNTQRFATGPVRAAATVGIVLLPLVCFGIVYRDMHTDPHWAFVVRHEQAREALSEVRAFESNIRPRVRETMAKAEKVYREQVQPVTIMHPDRRDAEKTKAAIQAAAEQQADLMKLADWLNQQKPFTLPKAEEATGAGKDYIQAGIEMFRQAQRALQGGEQWKKEDAALTAAETKFKQSRAAWYKLVP